MSEALSSEARSGAELRVNSFPVAPYHSFLLSALFHPPRPVAVVTYLRAAQQALEHFTTALPQSHSNRWANFCFWLSPGEARFPRAQAPSPEGP